MNDKQYFKIINLHAENIKKLNVIDITPESTQHTVKITGENGQGKSSVLDSILYAICGKNTHCDLPIRSGEKQGSIDLDIGDYKINRKFTEKGSYLSVENKEGFKTSSPQKILDDLMGEITFDPLSFTRFDPKKQYDVLKNLVEIDCDIDQVESQINEYYEERKLTNKEINSLEKVTDNIALEIPENVQSEKVNVSELFKHLTELKEINENFKKAEDDYFSQQREVHLLEEKLKTQTEILEQKKSNYDEALKNKVDQSKVEETQEKIEKSEQINKAVDLNEELKTKKELLERQRIKSESLTNKIKENLELKKTAIENAKFPVNGLSLDSGKVMYNEIPFDQISSAEQIKVSTAIAMKMNPRLRVIRIKDGSLLDDSSLKVIEKMAQDNDFQLWIECVKSDDPQAVWIEDGSIKEEKGGKL